MKNDLKPKLIAVIDMNKLRLFKARGIKIIEKLEEMPLHVHKEFTHESGSYQKGNVLYLGLNHILQKKIINISKQHF